MQSPFLLNRLPVIHPVSHQHRFVHCETSISHHVTQSEWSLHSVGITFFFIIIIISQIDSGANLITGRISIRVQFKPSVSWEESAVLFCKVLYEKFKILLYVLSQ